MSGTAFGGSVTRVTTTQELPLGFAVTVPNGELGVQTWVYVKAGAALAQGNVVGRATGAFTSPYTVILSVAADTRANVVGVAQHTIASASYGFVLRSGVGKVKTDDSLTAGCTFTTGADGEAVLFVNGEEEKVIGQAFAADTGDGTLVDAVIDCGF